MIIMSSDRKNIVDARLVSIQKNFGGAKNEKFFIMARFGSAGVVVGRYSDEKSAADELEKIYRAFADGAASYIVD
jgi:hypothetical protein